MAQGVQAKVTPVKLSRGYKVVWGIAALGTSLIAGVYAALLFIFYQDYLGLQARWWALASPVYAIWNALNDPLFGYLSDRTRSRRGRRIPYMRYTAPFLALAFILVWFAPRGAGQVVLFAWMLGTMLLYDTAYTIIGLVYSALLPEVSESDAERNDLQISSSLFGLLGTLLGFIIPDLFRPKTGATSLLPLQGAMIVVAVISAALILITAFRVKERPEFHCVDQPLGLRQALKYTFTGRSFLVLVAENFMVVLMQALLMGGVFYLADYVLQMNTMIALACVFIPLFAGVPVTSILRRRFGVVGAQQLFLVLAGIALVLVTVAPRPLILVCLAVAGFALAGPQTLTNVLFAQVADEDELRSGVRREGAFFGINALLTKPAQSVALALGPFILERTRFVTREAHGGEIFLDQPASALLGIRVIVGLIPGAAMLLGALILVWFPLRGEYLRRVQAAALALHARKRAQRVGGKHLTCNFRCAKMPRESEYMDGEVIAMPDDENVPEREVETEWEVETARETQIAREAEIEEETEQKVKHKILQVVMSRGAVLPVELAVQTYSFPEEIAEPLADLEEEGVIERQGLKGSEMIVLTQKGLEQLKAGLI